MIAIRGRGPGSIIGNCAADAPHRGLDALVPGWHDVAGELVGAPNGGDTVAHGRGPNTARASCARKAADRLWRGRLHPTEPSIGGKYRLI
jgi:hypothetical protein